MPVDDNVLETQIKSKDRVRNLAEVFTNKREVNTMLAFVEDEFLSPATTYFEPACGNGNFLRGILTRKLKTVSGYKESAKQFEIEFRVLQAVASIHGIDICIENITQARDRLRKDVLDFLSENFGTWEPTDGFWAALDIILSTNIQHGDMLNGTAAITITEWKTPQRFSFSRRIFSMDDMLRTGCGTKGIYRSIGQLPTQHYRRLK